MNLIAQMPNIGHERRDITDRPFKFWPVGDYVVVYSAEKQSIEIVRVLQGSREFGLIL